MLRAEYRSLSSAAAVRIPDKEDKVAAPAALLAKAEVLDRWTLPAPKFVQPLGAVCGACWPPQQMTCSTTQTANPILQHRDLQPPAIEPAFVVEMTIYKLACAADPGRSLAHCGHVHDLAAHL